MNIWQQIEWRAPLWLLLSLMPMLLHMLSRWRVQQWTRYAEPHLQAWAVRQDTLAPQQTWRVMHNALLWILLAIALAGPRLPLASVENKLQTRHDIDLMIVLDVSASMGAVDVVPSRIARAKLELREFLAQLRGERVGLIVFAGEAGLLLPLTDDINAFEHSLEVAEGSLFTAPGSHLGAALELAYAHLRDPSRTRAILLVSDAEASSLSGRAGEAVTQAARALAKARIPVYLFAVATQEGGAVPDLVNSTPLQAGQAWSRPDIASFRSVFESGGGRVVQASDRENKLMALHTQHIQHLPVSRARTDNAQRWRELFAYPLALALLLFVIQHVRIARRGLLAAALASGSIAQADDTVWREAYAAYSQKQYLVAQQHYRQLEGYQARMGEGAAAYRRKDFIYAHRQFTQALLLAHTPAQRADALLNIGNSFFYAGNLRAATDAFTGVLRYRAHDARALENLARVRSSLRRRNAMTPQQDGIPGRKGRGLGQAVNNAESSRGIEEDKNGPPLLGSLDFENAAEARAAGRQTVRSAAEIDADRRAALKKIELLNDQRSQTFKLMLKQDARANPQSDLLPW